MVIPIVDAASSRARNNWSPFAFVSGICTMYSTFGTSSNEALIFLIKHYRLPPLTTKTFKVTKLINKEKQHNQCEKDKDDNEEREDNKKKRTTKRTMTKMAQQGYEYDVNAAVPEDQDVVNAEGSDNNKDYVDGWSSIIHDEVIHKLAFYFYIKHFKYNF